MTPHLQPDDPSDYDEYIRRVARQEAVGIGNIIHGGGTNSLTNWLLGIMGVLVAAEILGGVELYAKVESMDNTMQLLLAGKIVIVRPADGK